MAAELFVDTSAWYPLAVSREPAHGAVTRALRERIRHGARVVTTNLVVAETHALLLRRTTRAAALAFVRHVAQPPTVVVHATPELDAQAVAEWLDPYDDQDFSFADAVSFAVMTGRRIQEALTLDHHFVAAGFRALPT
ncbi:MAG: type II toxin-antitoxin system VapC family toxin [Myxococcota bacterium]